MRIENIILVDEMMMEPQGIITCSNKDNFSSIIVVLIPKFVHDSVEESPFISSNFRFSVLA